MENKKMTEETQLQPCSGEGFDYCENCRRYTTDKNLKTFQPFVIDGDCLAFYSKEPFNHLLEDKDDGFIKD